MEKKGPWTNQGWDMSFFTQKLRMSIDWKPSHVWQLSLTILRWTKDKSASNHQALLPNYLLKMCRACYKPPLVGFSLRFLPVSTKWSCETMLCNITNDHHLVGFPNPLVLALLQASEAGNLPNYYLPSNNIIRAQKKYWAGIYWEYIASLKSC